MPGQFSASYTAQARYFHFGRVRRPRLGVIHVGITPKSDGAAEGMVNYAASPEASVASFHLAADRNSVSRGVNDWDTAWGAPGANADGLQLEQAGTVQGRDGFLDAYSAQMIREQSARVVADWHGRYALPLVHLSVAQVADRSSRGFCTHYDVTRAFPTLGDHTDPDDGAVPGYPFDVLFAAAWQHPFGVPAVKHNPFDWRKEPVRFMQWSLGIPVDGRYGAQTDAILAAWQTRHGYTVQHALTATTATDLSHYTK